jgi:hypothetical protein
MEPERGSWGASSVIPAIDGSEQLSHVKIPPVR